MQTVAPLAILGLATAAVLTSCGSDKSPVVDRSRLIPIPNIGEWHPTLGFSGITSLVVDSGGLFVTDPIYLADVYNPNSDSVAQYLREHAVIIGDFGGDISCPVWYEPPFLVLPTSTSVAEGFHPQGASLIAQEVGCDSGSFAFIPMSTTLPSEVAARIEQVRAQRNGAALNIPSGTYHFYFEQFTPEPQHQQSPEWYRNIVAEHTTQ